MFPPSKPASLAVGSDAFWSPEARSPQTKEQQLLMESKPIPNQSPAYGEQIKKRRFDLKMTVVECRKILSVNKSALVDWELGRRKPSRENREKIAQFLVLSLV
jgi:DNA-binding transcriptional regulator YiaG